MRTEDGTVVRLADYSPPPYRVVRTELTFRLDPVATQVVARSVVERGEETAPGTPLVLDGDELELAALKIAGQTPPRESRSVDGQALTIDRPPSEKRFEIEIVTRLNPSANTQLMGLYRSGGTYCTQCEAEGFRRITFFPDRPDVLAVYTTRIEARRDEAPLLLGNGNPMESGEMEDGWHYAVWHDPFPKPSYLFALVAGNLDSVKKPFVTASGRSVELAIYVEKGKAERARYALDALVRAMRWDEAVFGREYDLDVFNIVAVSDFNMGAMENKGLNIFNDKYVLADPQTATDADYAAIERIVAHEYFHNWTGNRITCRDWFQLCLKEGLTVFRDQEFCGDQRSRAVQRVADVRTLRASQFPEDAGPLAHPVRPSEYREINNFYTATVYEKGAEIVRMLALLLGEKGFRAGMDLYFDRHDGEAATIEDFLACFQEANATDLSQFSLWYAQAGTPVLAVSAEYDRGTKRLTIDVEQTLAPTPGQPEKQPMHIPLRLGFVSPQGIETGAWPDDRDGADHLLHLTDRSSRFVFDNVNQRPALSINRGFAAPVLIDMAQQENDLVLLALHDSDPFNRWQAMQDYAMRFLVPASRALTRGERPRREDRFCEIAAAIATEETLEPAFRAQLLTLPDEAEIAQAIGRDVDPQAVQIARRQLMAQIGERTEAERENVLSALDMAGDYAPDAENAGKRSLHNLLLTLGVVAGNEAAKAASLMQFDEADNMTDRFAALMRIVHCHEAPEAAAQALDAFAERYRDDALVLDKWFAVQASAPGSGAPGRVRKLMGHEAFSIDNSNRVRAVIGQFAMANPSGFHAADGSGYALIAEFAGRLDATNPQVAARLLTAFSSWRMMSADRRKLARASLAGLAEGAELSRDSADIVQRMLADPDR